MPNEFDPVHQATRAAIGYLGQLERQLSTWDRNFTAHLGKLKSQKAKVVDQVEQALKVFDDGWPRLVKMEIAAKNDKTKKQEHKTNFGLVFKRYKESWDEIFIPFAEPVLKTVPKFKDVTEMNTVIRSVKAQLIALKQTNPAKDGKSMNTLKFKFKDASWGALSSSVAKVDDAERVLKFESKISGTRVEYIGERPKIVAESEMVFWKDAPEFVRETYWWFIPHTNMAALRVSEGVFDLKIDYGSNRGERLSNVELFSKFTDNMFVKISGDDQITFWVRENDPQAWAELVEYFGSEKEVLNSYIRWYH